jgi:hypothetical protein
MYKKSLIAHLFFCSQVDLVAQRLELADGMMGLPLLILLAEGIGSQIMIGLAIP